MEFNVQCADAKTGRDRVVTLDAADARDAEKKAAAMGLLVTAVFPRTIREEEPEIEIALDEEPPPPPAPRSARGRSSSRSAAIESSPAPQSDRPRNYTPVAPEYLGLKLAILVLHSLAVVLYLSGLLVVLVGGYFLLKAGFSYAQQTLVVGGGTVILAAILHGMSAAGEALRDIARNSFGKSV